MHDRLLRGSARDLRFFAVDSTTAVRDAYAAHHPSWAAGIVLGRLITATAMMGYILKNPDDAVTISLSVDGPIGGGAATAHNDGSVKAWIHHPQAGEDSVPKSLGKGTLTVVRDSGLRRPYQGEVELVRGDIATDLAHYFMLSEQKPTAVGLGVVPNEHGSVRKAGGFLIQLLPDAAEEVIASLEDNLAHFPQLTDMLDIGYSIEQIVMEMILKGLEPKITDSAVCRYRCDCSRDRFRKGISLLGRDELAELVTRGESVVAECHFCNRTYSYSPREIEAILHGRRKLRRK
jgi:molecular chaperone Hsp33